MPSTPAGSAAYGGREAGLRADALGVWHVLAIGLARQSVALPIYFNVGFIEQSTGPIVPVVFGLVMVAAIPTAVSFAVMNKRRPSAGGAFTWLGEPVAPPGGAWIGWVQATQYTLACILQPIMFGLFGNALLAVVGVKATFTTAVAGGLVAVTARLAEPCLGCSRHGLGRLGLGPAVGRRHTADPRLIRLAATPVLGTCARCRRHPWQARNVRLLTVTYRVRAAQRGGSYAGDDGPRRG